MAPLRLISLHLLLASWWMIASLINAADFYDATADPGGTTLGFSHEPDDVVVARGQSARLDCLVRLPPFPSVDDRNGTTHLDEPIAFDIHWFQDGKAIVLPDSRRQLLTNGSLYFDKVLHKRVGRSSSDEGIYNCLAQQRQTSSSSSSAGAFVSRNVSVRVAVLAKEFTTSPNNATAETGDPARFACEIESVPEAEITWEKDGVPIVTQTENQEDGDNGTDSINSSSVHPPIRFIKLDSGKILHIYSVQSDDTGNYRCVARNEMAEKERRSQAGRLVVSPDTGRPIPQFISPPLPSDMWAVHGGNMTIECLATGTTVKWTLNSTTLPSTGLGYLTLTNIHPTMAGHYSCATITGGTSVANLSLTQSTVVHVATVPQFIRLPKSQVFPTAKTVRFECEVTGIPSPEIRWFKDGRIVPIGGRIKNRIRNGGTFSELVLSNTVTGDSGIYQCQAANRAGIVSVSARLLVNVSEGTRPEPPSNLKAVALTATVVMLTWDPPRNVPVDDVKAYTVHYMPLATGQQQSSGATSTNNEELQEVAINSSFRIENLKRNANYSFYVRAYVRKLASDPSDKLIFNPAILIQSKDQPESSLPSAPLPRPTNRTPPSPTTPNVTLVPLTPTTLKVTWRGLNSSTSSASTSASFYKIQYRRHRFKDVDTEAYKGVIHEYTITGLHPGRKYDVRVLPGSMNGAGSGQWYTVEMPRVMVDDGSSTTLPRSLPPVMELLTTNSTSVFVTWDSVGVARQTLANIQLTYRIQGSRETSPVVILPTASGFRWITGLKPGSIYEFQLINDEDGPSVTGTIRTLWDAGFEQEEEDTDSEVVPIRMETEIMSSNAMQLSWYVLPPENAANILYYTIRYVAIPAESTDVRVLTQFIRSTGHQIQLTNLTPFTLYRITIRSHDRHGRSSTYNPTTDARTLDDLPGPPLDLSFSIESSAGSTGQLFWKAPYPVKGNILDYAIFVSIDPEAPIDTWKRKEEPGVWMRSQLRDLVPGTVYHVRMQARTSVGWGPLTAVLICPFLPAEGTGSISSVTDEKPNDPAVRFSEQYLGAFIGLAVSVGLAVACSVSMLLRARCIKRMSPAMERHPSQLASSQVQQIPAVDVVTANGLAACNDRLQHGHKKEQHSVRRNGSLRNSRERSADPMMLEMEAFVPMLATIPVEDMPSHLDTKGGYPSGSRASVAGKIITPTTATIRKENQDEDDEDCSELPLLSLSCSVVGHPGGLDGTILSQGTETTCLSLDYSGRNRRRSTHYRQGSLHDDGDSSLHSLDSRTTSSSQRHLRSSIEALSCSSDESSRSLRQDAVADTGMCHADHHQIMNDSGLVVVTSGGAVTSSSSNNNRSQTTSMTPKADQEQQLVIST